MKYRKIMSQFPTVRPCVAPIQFLCHDYGPVQLPTLEIAGGTILFLEVNRKRYVLTARHVWDGILTLANKNTGRQHAAFIYADKFLPLQTNEITVRDDLDVIAMTPAWLSSEIAGYDFYQGDVVSVSARDTVTTWGFPGAKRKQISNTTESCPMENLVGEATNPCEGRFKFATSAAYDLGGFSGAPVFRANGQLVGLVSEASSSFGIVTCCDLQSMLTKMRRHGSDVQAAVR
jgi:hypothetical protein